MNATTIPSELNGLDVHAWNGYSSVSAEGGFSRRQVIAKALAHTRQGRKEVSHNLASKYGNRTYQYELKAIEDGEHTTIMATHSYDCYGWRDQIVYFTTRQVVIHRTDDDEYEIEVRE